MPPAARSSGIPSRTVGVRRGVPGRARPGRRVRHRLPVARGGAPCDRQGDSMPHPDLTEVIVILDRSGSMASIRSDMEGGFDAFIAEQRKAPGQCQITLVQFDDVVEMVYEGYPIS